MQFHELHFNTRHSIYNHLKAVRIIRDSMDNKGAKQVCHDFDQTVRVNNPRFKGNPDEVYADFLKWINYANNEKLYSIHDNVLAFNKYSEQRALRIAYEAPKHVEPIQDMPKDEKGRRKLTSLSIERLKATVRACVMMDNTNAPSGAIGSKMFTGKKMCMLSFYKNAVYTLETVHGFNTDEYIAGLKHQLMELEYE